MHALGHLIMGKKKTQKKRGEDEVHEKMNCGLALLIASQCPQTGKDTLTTTTTT